jgi:hypothetical protein
MSVSKGFHVDGHLRLGGESTTDENEQMYIKSAGALGVLRQRQQTPRIQDTKLILQTGDTSNSNITLEGNTEEQFMTFGVGATERMRIEQDGNVGINVTSASYTLDVGGDIRFDGNLYQGGGPFVATPWTITGDDIYYTVADGSVGIGTATTGATFHTEGNVVINTTMSDSTSNGGVVIDGGIAVSGNVHTGNLYVVNNVHIQSVQVDATPDLGSVCAVAATTDQAVSITNTTASTSVGSGALTVDGGVGVDGNLYVGGNLAFPTPAVATTAGNVITWNSTTGLLEDSGGLLANKFAVVSEQPPSALTANSTTVTDHGVYKLTTSGLATNSNTWNAFNGDASYAWTSPATYTGTDNVYGGSVQLSAVSSTGSGEWLAVEFPYKTTLRHMKLTPAAVASYPGTANLYATNDSTSWTLLKEWSDVVPGSESEVQTVVVDASEAYKKFAIVPTKAAGASTSVAIERWQLFAESFAVDGGKVAMASGAITGGNTVVDQTGPHARGPVPLRKYPEVALTSNVGVGGYVASSSVSTLEVNFWNVFNGGVSGNEGWVVGNYYSSTAPGAATSSATLFNGRRGEYLDLTLPNAIKVDYFVIKSRQGANGGAYIPEDAPGEGYLYGSNDGTNWTEIKYFSGLTYGGMSVNASRSEIIQVNSTSFYKYLRLQATHRAGQRSTDQFLSIGELEYYGYEETSDPDTSVDTKITSQFNLPDTTGVKLYIDGDKGSTATDFSGEGHTLTENNATYDSAEKAWSFSSLSTSNVTMSTGDFAMEGTHPHSVSLWFNAANVSSNATLFHVGTATGEGDAKTAISLTETGHLGWIDGGDNQFLSANTWHNLVYATQGGGGVRTCYLDGRKLGDVSVQDTFGKYPPFAMTGYSEYGYTVSTSLDISTGQAWEAFDGIEDNYQNAWQGDGSTYSTTTRLHTGDETTTVSGIGYLGDWIQMEFPHKMYLSYIDILPMVTYGVERMPGIAIFAGSNDATTWALIRSITKNDHTAGNYSNYILNSDTCYKYIRIIWNELTTAGSTDSYRNRAAAQEIKYYGHKENDTTRFPVSSTVLKYPHVAMTGPAQRGYVATASSVYATTDGTNREAYKAFDESTNYTNPNRWICEDGKYNTSGVYTGSESHTDVDGNVENGEWLKIQLPRKVTVDHFNVRSYPTSGSQTLINYAILGSNDDSTWYQVHKRTGSSSGTTDDTDITPSGTYSSSPYKIFLFIWHDKVANANQHVSLSELSIYGTEEDLDVVARVGEGLDGKVANFRVYDKYLHEEQALELWDAQKDQFGRAESSVVVHKGRLGVGTTEPEGRFAVLDEPGDMEEFPPRAMTDYETYMDGHGVFKVSASSDGEAPSYTIWKAFDKTVNGVGWHDQNVPYTDGVYSGTRSLDGISGEWITLKLPYTINLKSVAIAPRSGDSLSQRSAGSGVILGSNDEVNWDQLHSFSDLTATDYEFTNINNIIAPGYYKTIAIVVTELVGKPPTININSLNISEIKFFGTRERGQSTLHDGQLTLTKNLTVPRIGPALDADDTPRRDRLVVEYNTSTNPTANSTVKDTSGRGVDGLMYNGASYDATEKALVFDGSNDYIKTNNIGNPAGGWVHSFSAWFKLDNAPSGEHLFQIGNGLTSGSFSPGNSYSGFNFTATNTLWYFYSNDYTFDFVPSPGIWYHIVGIYPGGSAASRTLYVNGVKQSVKSGTTPGTLTWDVEANSDLAIGADWSRHDTGYGTPVEGQSHWMEGYIANFKLYDVALTPDEVKRLYDMGRLGNVIAQPVHIAAPLQVEKTLRVPIDGTTPGTTGMVRFNTSLEKLQVHNGTTWITVGNTSATGGTVTNADGYTIHTFTTSDDFVVYSGGDVEYLIVAGGGGGGTRHQGGGGAGGMLTGTDTNLTAGTYTITVGTGGAGKTGGVASTAGNGTTGTDTTAIGFTAKGGGGSQQTGGSSGGGAATNNDTSTSPDPYDLISGDQGSQGYRGGSGNGSATGESSYNDGGGGGAGGVGGDGTSTTPGDGGVGLQSSISGTSTYYAGGGGGGGGSGGTDEGTGGSGGGGRGGRARAAVDGTDGVGGGGGSGGFIGGTNYNGGSGGDGIVIIRYLT